MAFYKAPSSIRPTDGVEYTEPSTNVGHDGARIAETQTKGVPLLRRRPHRRREVPDGIRRATAAPWSSTRSSRMSRRCRRSPSEPHPSGQARHLHLDFVNDPDKIKEAFGRYYSDAALSVASTSTSSTGPKQSFATSKYMRRKTSKPPLVAFGKDDKRNVQEGSSALKPAVVKYEALDDDVRYQFRRKVRSFCKWYATLRRSRACSTRTCIRSTSTSRTCSASC